jgi:hypothetical protein
VSVAIHKTVFGTVELNTGEMPLPLDAFGAMVGRPVPGCLRPPPFHVRDARPTETNLTHPNRLPIEEGSVFFPWDLDVVIPRVWRRGFQRSDGSIYPGYSNEPDAAALHSVVTNILITIRFGKRDLVSVALVDLMSVGLSRREGMRFLTAGTDMVSWDEPVFALVEPQVHLVIHQAANDGMEALNVADLKVILHGIEETR